MAHADTLEAVARELFSKQAKKLAPQTIKRDPEPLEEHTFETLGRAPARPRCRTEPGAGSIPGRIARGGAGYPLTWPPGTSPGPPQA
jgi:hypothetical protein